MGFILEQTILLPLSILAPIRISLPVFILYVIYKVIEWYLKPGDGVNPFAKDGRKDRRPYIMDQKKRDEVLKQSFSRSKVPDNLDAVIIGSGIGGLASAAIMARAGKKVLVLEQHDQAGGCCHTFIDKGYEFDVGIHYIGEMLPGCVNRTLVDQISEGQVEWTPIAKKYDVVSLGYGDKNRRYPVESGAGKWKSYLLETFPKEKEAIEKYFELMANTGSHSKINGLIKLLPLWVSKIFIKTGLIHKFTTVWSGDFKRSTLDIVESITSNKDLQAIFCYCWGDYGTAPGNSHFVMQALLNRHFSKGAFYPVGGASEIALNTIPVIESAGGKVLVRASVKEILVNDGRVSGVRVQKGSDVVIIPTKTVISGAGLYNTFQSLLPKQVAAKSYFTQLAGNLKPATAAMSIFVGLNASNEDLKLVNDNTWAFIEPEDALGKSNYENLDPDEAVAKDIPLMFISFPSTKDPNWKKHEGREDKATMALVTLAPWEWFKKWDKAPLKRRGDDYDALKNAIGDNMIEQACKLFPQLKNHIDYIEVGTPVTNSHYLAQPHGEIYGLDHTYTRFDPWVSARLRPKTDIPGLFLTGQDVMTGGFTGALYGGVLAACSVLGRNLLSDLEKLNVEIYGKDAVKRHHYQT